jgi:hypothetical protein
MYVYRSLNTEQPRDSDLPLIHAMIAVNSWFDCQDRIASSKRMYLSQIQFRYQVCHTTAATTATTTTITTTRPNQMVSC